MIDPSLQEAAEIAGDRWVLLALGALRDGARRFGDLAKDMPGIAPNILIDRLRRMERHGLITAAPYSQRPRRFVYDLTESGRELAAVLPGLSCWAARRTGGAAPTHANELTGEGCGSSLEVRLWCPVCATVVDEPEHAHQAGPDDRTGGQEDRSGAPDEELRWV